MIMRLAFSSDIFKFLLSPCPKGPQSTSARNRLRVAMNVRQEDSAHHASWAEFHDWVPPLGLYSRNRGVFPKFDRKSQSADPIRKWARDDNGTVITRGGTRRHRRRCVLMPAAWQ